MSLGTFLAKFAHFADAPNGVEKMRDLVLDLAVTGKLAPQDPQEPPASVLLTEIRSEREQLVRARKIKSRSSKLLELDQLPFALPSSWEWASLSDVGYELGQKIPNERFTYIDVGSIDSLQGCISSRVEILEPKDAPIRARKRVAPGSVIYSTVRPYLLNIAIVEQEFGYEPIASTAFAILHPFRGIDRRYLFYWLRSRRFTAYVQECMKGMAYPAVNDENFYSGFIPLPPSAEQSRIAAKVDELMGLCDLLEAQEKEREVRHKTLARASLDRFADAPTPANLTFLFHPSYDIAPGDLRKSILSLAVQGKLVVQDPGDEPAPELLKRIAAERLIGAREKGARDKKSLVLVETNVDLPNGWAVEALANVVDPTATISYGVLVPGPDVEDGVPFVRVQDLYLTHHPKLPTKKIASTIEAPYARTRLRGGEILLCVVGATIGKLGTVPHSWAGANIARAVARIAPVASVLSDYMVIVLRSEQTQRRFTEMTRTLAQPTLNIGQIAQLRVPIPPLAEQRRIVAKVDQLMGLVDQLEAQLTTARAASTTLLEALVDELTSSRVSPHRDSLEPQPCLATF